jgi:beta-glucosidase
VAQAAVDTACARMLTLKFRAGLFENPFADAGFDRLTGNAERTLWR